MEHLWGHLKGLLAKASEEPRSLAELKRRMIDLWEKVPPEICEKQVSSIPDRKVAAIHSRGGPTKY